MNGIIRIDTPVIGHQMELETTMQEEIYDKSRQLKENVSLLPGTPFVVWMQLPSRMNFQNPDGSI
ncbi:MAG TPA: hypothetical protein VJ647_02815 [Chitinophagaceae bacterium]|nr:hypothetical protein [Chitinophagaceae bacterium]